MRRFRGLRYLLFPLMCETPRPQRRPYESHSSGSVGSMSSLPMQVLLATSTKVRWLVKKHTGLSANFPTAELGDKDPDLWWNTFEVNIRGVYNIVRFVLIIPYLSRDGILIAVKSLPIGA